jgi:hypothetical protein
MKYQAIERKTGNPAHFRSAFRLMDWLFAVGGIDAMRRYWVYKDGAQVPMPEGGEVYELARWLQAYIPPKGKTDEQRGR